MLFFFKQKTEYELRISDWSSDVCSSDLERDLVLAGDRRVRLDAGAFLQILLGEADGDLLLAAVDAIDRLGRDEQPAPRQPVPGSDDEVADLPAIDRKSVESGMSGSVRVAHGGRRTAITKRMTAILRTHTANRQALDYEQ